jgi:hypothetical protein
VELTPEQRTALRVTIAEGMGFVWMCQRLSAGSDQFMRFLYRPEWEQDANYTWSEEWERWDGEEDIPPFSDALRSVPDYPTDPAQIGPMLEHFRKNGKGAYRRWGIRGDQDGWTVHLCHHGEEGFASAPTLELAICLALQEYLTREGTDNG